MKCSSHSERLTLQISNVKKTDKQIDLSDSLNQELMLEFRQEKS